MIQAHIPARRIFLRLDPARAGQGAIAAVARLAAALNAELAARLVADTRFASALSLPAFASSPLPESRRPDSARLDAAMRQAERMLRRALTNLAEREHLAWSFEVVHCAGVFARECQLEANDLIAIELPPIESARTELREEVEDALARARGIILFPSTAAPAKGPVVVAGDPSRFVVETSEEVARALKLPLTRVETSEDPQAVARAVRKFQPALAVMEAHDPLVAQFLNRPRYLRELGAPLLLLNARA